ncbi:MAG TPA: hypothetical protein ENF41_03465 [Candidatus Bathyarchaeota archaeon]|nr:hypothetical protein [Candidatus Bathyarchaeota archaeon]
MESYEYFTLLNEINSSLARKLIHIVVRNIADWKIDPQVLMNTRMEIGSLIHLYHSTNLLKSFRVKFSYSHFFTLSWNILISHPIFFLTLSILIFFMALSILKS